MTRLLNLEKQLPSYKYSVSVSCLKVIRKLQKCGHLPPSSKIYRSYAAYGQYVDVRVAALECLIDYVKSDGKWEDMEVLLDLIETDPDPMVKHKLLRLLTDNPPFERAHQHRLDRPHLVERLWMNMNQLAAYDSKIRCDLVDFYYMLYGVKKPACLSSKEMAEILRQKEHRSALGQIPRVKAAAPPVKREGEEEEDPNMELNSFLTDQPLVPGGGGSSLDGLGNNKRKVIEYEDVDGDIFGSGSGGGGGGGGGSISLKTETLDEVIIGDVAQGKVTVTTMTSSTTTTVTVASVPQQETKKLKTDGFYSDNSISLPGLAVGGAKAGTSGGPPVGFEPGMFQSQDEQAMRIKAEKVRRGNERNGDRGELFIKLHLLPLQKKKKKEKKKHKHKHKHKKDKERDRSMKEKKDPNVQRLIRQEDTMSSSSNSTMDMNV